MGRLGYVNLLDHHERAYAPIVPKLVVIERYLNQAEVLASCIP